VVLELHVARTLSSELVASPSSILQLSTWSLGPRGSEYYTVSELLTDIRSLRCVEFLMPTYPSYRISPSDETLIKIGERTIFRLKEER